MNDRAPRPRDPQTTVFVSYSRADSDFVEDLVGGLSAEGDFTILRDLEAISGGESWRERISTLILECDTMVFVVSPDSIASEICTWEVEEAIRCGRRILPVLYRKIEFGDAPAGLRALNSIPFHDGQMLRGMAKLVEALRMDLDWLRDHTRLGAKAFEWDRADRPEGLLLRGKALRAAQSLLSNRPANAPDTPDVVRAFLDASAEEEASLSEQRAAQIAALEQANAEAEAARATAEKARRKIRNWLFAALVGLVAAVSTGTLAYFNAQEIERQAQLGVATRTLSLKLTLVAIHLVNRANDCRAGDPYSLDMARAVSERSSRTVKNPCDYLGHLSDFAKGIVNEIQPESNFYPPITCDLIRATKAIMAPAREMDPLVSRGMKVKPDPNHPFTYLVSKGLNMPTSMNWAQDLDFTQEMRALYALNGEKIDEDCRDW